MPVDDNPNVNMPIYNPEKSHSKPHNNSAERREEAQAKAAAARPQPPPMMEIGVLPDVTTDARHKPFITVYVGENRVNLTLAQGTQLATTMFQAITMSFQDSMLTEFFQLVMGMSADAATARVGMYRDFREARALTNAEIARAVQQPGQPQPQPPQPEGGSEEQA